VDATIKQHLDELNTLLGKRIFKRGFAQSTNGKLRKAESNLKPETAKTEGATGLYAYEAPSVDPEVPTLLQRPLTPKHTPDLDVPSGAATGVTGGSHSIRWAPESLAAIFASTPEVPDGLTLSDYIDMTSDLSALKYAFGGNLSANWFNLDYNSKTVLDGYPALTDYLIAYGFHVMSLDDVNALKNFILSNQMGVKNVANYAILSAARTIVDKEQLVVPQYNIDGSDTMKRIRAANLSLSSASFKTSLDALIGDQIFNAKELALIDSAGIGTIPTAMRLTLVKYIRASAVPITKDNVKFFLPLFISQIGGTTTPVDTTTDVDVDQSDKDFEVDFLQDDDSLIQISRSAVKCASQMYYGMILGDELQVFHVMNYFTHKFLVRGNIEIQDSQLRNDLQTYVFSNRFTDLRTGKLVDRTRPAERHMFYRQVFNYGHGQVTEDLIVNQEFPKLWKVLILESAKYLERAQASFNPDSYVSRQNVMQAVEDLQYNLSTHCTGMANVITPMIYSELNFIIQRVFMHPEILRQVVPAGGTWWRVVETLYMGLKHARPKSTVIYNKAKLGHDILRSIADYNPAQFEDDAAFSAFISNVDAFITTQSILQEALTDELKSSDGDDASPGMERNGMPANMPGMPDMSNMPGMKNMPGMPGAPGMPPMPAAVGAGGGSGASGDEWDF
jgi:hypothetical protein